MELRTRRAARPLAVSCAETLSNPGTRSSSSSSPTLMTWFLLFGPLWPEASKVALKRPRPRPIRRSWALSYLRAEVSAAKAAFTSGDSASAAARSDTSSTLRRPSNVRAMASSRRCACNRSPALSKSRAFLKSFTYNSAIRSGSAARVPERIAWISIHSTASSARSDGIQACGPGKGSKRWRAPSLAATTSRSRVGS